MNYKKLLKNSKAISPIFATLILIAIAVIAGVVVYMFVSGTLATMTSGGTAGQEKVSVQAASYEPPGTATGDSGSPTYGLVTIYLEQTGGPAATVNGLIIKDSSGNTITSATTITGNATPLVNGQLTTIWGQVLTTTATLSSSVSYTVTVTTAAGGSFVSSSFLG